MDVAGRSLGLTTAEMLNNSNKKSNSSTNNSEMLKDKIGQSWIGTQKVKNRNKIAQEYCNFTVAIVIVYFLIAVGSYWNLTLVLATIVVVVVSSISDKKSLLTNIVRVKKNGRPDLITGIGL
ncbi:Hypothetical predicted protein [Octopus vulgaris]|uniref:Uncharacterized protein n=1 Tax=Octopus vulgaris TaxID=6645 RepID=A0AA36B5H3_OCTVU|nr:Hypothetical predicted protein [Octopus vulgaris]